MNNEPSNMHCIITYTEQYHLIRSILGQVCDDATSEDTENPETAKWLEEVDLALHQVQRSPHHACSGNVPLNRAVDRMLKAVEIVAGKAELDVYDLTEQELLDMIYKVAQAQTSDLT